MFGNMTLCTYISDMCVVFLKSGATSVIREDADSRTAGIFIRDTACFHCYLLNYESQFIESQ